MQAFTCHITRDVLKVQDALDFISDDACGALQVFTGVVRNTAARKRVTGVTYDAHPELAEKAFACIGDEILARWSPIRLYIAHFCGYLPVGGISLVIGTGTPHREANFAAQRSTLEEIKKRAPIWKCEHYADGENIWLPGTRLKAPSC